jgi:hypothetical protein
MLIAALEIAGCLRHDKLCVVIVQVLYPGAELLGFHTPQYHDPLAIPVNKYLIVLAYTIGKDFVFQDMVRIDFLHLLMFNSKVWHMPCKIGFYRISRRI